MDHHLLGFFSWKKMLPKLLETLANFYSYKKASSDNCDESPH